MFKVGEYYEDEAKTLANYLKDAGIKVDIRGLVLARTEYSASLQGKLSMVKEKAGTTDMAKREQYLFALKNTLEKGATSETFEDLFLEEIFPGWKESVAKFRLLQENNSEIDEVNQDSYARTWAECIVAVDFAEKVINLNDIEFGSPIGDRLDDPIISIPVSSDYEDTKEPLLFQRMDVDMVKKYEITIDEFSASLFDEIDEEFQDEFGDEFLKIRSMGLIIEHLVDVMEKGKMDIEDFAELCDVQFGDKWLMNIEGSEVAEEIARSLEKMGMLKMKGNTIKWKGLT
ncbi:MAG: hypothetical protein MUE87_00525 [Methanothrix sp.]|jgi:hypothetical protein|nr:hypothetical protein [Methanothrix sp.]